jgi:hypothetical protein
MGYQVWLAALVRPFWLGNPSLPLATCLAFHRSCEGWEGGNGGVNSEVSDGGENGEGSGRSGKHPQGGECCREGEGVGGGCGAVAGRQGGGGGGPPEL